MCRWPGPEPVTQAWASGGDRGAGGSSAPLCDDQIDQLDRKGRKPLEAMGFMEQGGGAGATGKGDHQQTGGRLTWSGAGGGALTGALQHLAMTHRARRHGHKGSTGGGGLPRASRGGRRPDRWRHRRRGHHHGESTAPAGQWRPGGGSTQTAGTTCTTAVQPRKPPGSGIGESRVHEGPILPAGPFEARFRSRSPWCHSCAAGCPRSAAASAPPGSGTPASDQRDPGGRHQFPAPPRPARGRC